MIYSVLETLCFTGHRPDKLGGYEPNPLQDWVRDRVANIIYRAINKGYFRFICGGALGLDWIAAEQVIEITQEKPKVELILALPFKGYNSKWPLKTIERFELEIESNADKVIYICDPGYAPWKMQKRNEWMVDNSGGVIATWDGSEGGTANAYRYAREKGKPVYRINPITKTADWERV
jgi:uncharacterized phage-like protein YoqJ